MTPPEARLWAQLRRNHFGFQVPAHPIGPYILDFYCAAARLAVEVDGAVHGTEDQVRHDRIRTAWLGERGVRVVRVSAVHVRG